MTREEIIDRMERMSEYAVHKIGAPRFVMSLDDGIALCEAVEILKCEQSMLDRVLEIIDKKAVYFGLRDYAWVMEEMKQEILALQGEQE